MERNEVYQRISQERDYQIQRWVEGKRDGDKKDDDKDIATWLIYIEEHLNQAKNKLYHLDEKAAKDHLRKIAALAVAAMEIHGCPERKSFMANITSIITPEP